jgi:hypothetical protein
MAQPRQRRTGQRPGQFGRRHLAAEPQRLLGPKIGEIDLAELFGSGAGVVARACGRLASHAA